VVEVRSLGRWGGTVEGNGSEGRVSMLCWHAIRVRVSPGGGQHRCRVRSCDANLMMCCATLWDAVGGNTYVIDSGLVSIRPGGR